MFDYFRLDFKTGPNNDVTVRADTDFGPAGPVTLTVAEAARLGDLITAVFTLLYVAERRQKSAPPETPENN